MATGNKMISDVLDELVVLLEGLTITSPKSMTISKAYPYLADPNEEVPPNIWQMEWGMAPVDITRMMAVRDLAFVVRMQYLAGPTSISELSILHEISTSFFEALVLALFPVNVDARTFQLAQSINGKCSRTILRGGDPTVGLIGRGGKVYVGAEAFLDVYFNDFWADFNR